MSRLRSIALTTVLAAAAACANDSISGPSGAVRVSFDAGSATLDAIGRTLHPLVDARDGQGRPIDPTLLSFRSSNPSVATIDQNGVITATGDGDATIEAAYFDIASGTLQLHVRARITFVARLRSSQGPTLKRGDSASTSVLVQAKNQ